MKPASSAVIDTSVLIRRWGLDKDKDYPPELDELLDAADEGHAKLMAPWLLNTEVFNVVVFSKQISEKVIDEGKADRRLSEFSTMPFTFVADQELFAKAFDLVREQRITIYDAFYVALALREKTTLITVDEKQKKAWLAAKAGRRRVDEPIKSK